LGDISGRKGMRKLSLLIFFLAVLSLAFVPVACSKKKKKDLDGFGTGTGINPGGSIGELIDAINSDRTASGAGALIYGTNLAAVAQAYADYFASRKYCNGYKSDLDSKSPETRITEAGITFIKAGETGVVSKSATTASAAMSKMSASVLNDPDYKYIGVGCSKFTTTG
jgi:hypothetical protein